MSLGIIGDLCIYHQTNASYWLISIFLNIHKHCNIPYIVLYITLTNLTDAILSYIFITSLDKICVRCVKEFVPYVGFLIFEPHFVFILLLRNEDWKKKMMKSLAIWIFQYPFEHTWKYAVIKRVVHKVSMTL